MMIISFAWTTAAFLAGRKTRTRREWSDGYASRFHIGDICQAWNRVPRVRGAYRIGYLKITGLKKENIALATEEDFEKEGFAYMAEQTITIWNKTPRQAFDDWIDSEKVYWVVDFENLAAPISTLTTKAGVQKVWIEAEIHTVKYPMFGDIEYRLVIPPLGVIRVTSRKADVEELIARSKELETK